MADEARLGIHDSGARQAATQRTRRALEPTLVIRDRREADELRKEMERRARVIERERLRSTLTWIAAGLFAFALGGLIAFVAARRDGTEVSKGDGSTVQRIAPAEPEPVRANTPVREDELETIDLDAPQ